jgi:prophage antirepressor-like protein
MIEEIKTDNNCIIKAFENNPIAILQEYINNKKVYYFKGSDIGKALTNIQSYDDEMVVRKAYDPQGTLQDTIFLTSQGVHRLLYNSEEAAKKFRKWIGNIIDDSLGCFCQCESTELKRQLEENKKELERTKKQLDQLEVKRWYDSEPGDTIYDVKSNKDNVTSIEKSKNSKKRQSWEYDNDYNNYYYS